MQNNHVRMQHNYTQFSFYKVHVQTTTSDFYHVFQELEYYVDDVFSYLLIELDFN